jgi:hypothetical protein
MVEHPAGYKAPPRPGKLDAGVVVAFDEIQLSRHPGSIGFGAAVPRPARLHAYASPIPFLESAQGLLPAWAGSPLAGRVSHPLDGTQSFMKASPPPIPFDQQSLVALDLLSLVLRDYGGVDERTASAIDQLIPVERRLYGQRRKQ